MKKEKVLKDIETLQKELNNCTIDLEETRVKDDHENEKEILSRMENLTDKAVTQLGFIYDYIEHGIYTEKKQIIEKVFKLYTADFVVENLNRDGWEVKQMIRGDQDYPLLLLCERGE